MKIPAIKAKIGTWIYYVSTLSFKQVSEFVKPINDELHKSEFLRDLLQRSITENYKSIANYIKTQDERFFNALILAVYDGEPKWHEVRLENDDVDEYMGLGVLELSGDEIIFPVDGQHRVEGIKKIVREEDKYNDEKIPVVFIGHKKDEEGMQRARRLFSTLNRYAKPVSMRDIIALDEDDIIAIASRELIDEYPLFSINRILDSKTKAIPESNNSAFTTIITFYECNKIILSMFLSNKTVENIEGKKMKGNSKVNEYIRFRPSDEDILQFTELCLEYWQSLVDGIQDIKVYVENKTPDTKGFRNKDGGNILFRPAVLVPFTKAVVRVAQNQHQSFNDVIKTIPKSLFNIKNRIWKNVIWNTSTHTMIMNNQVLAEMILLYYINPKCLSEREVCKFKNGLKDLNQLMDDDVVEEIIKSAVGSNDE